MMEDYEEEQHETPIWKRVTILEEQKICIATCSCLELRCETDILRSLRRVWKRRQEKRQIADTKVKKRMKLLIEDGHEE